MRMLPILLVALFIAGCGQADQSAPDATSVTDAAADVAEDSGISLPPVTASLVRFTMPGMT